MANIITDLWNGNIAPCEHCGAKDTQANRLYSLMERNREALRRDIPDAQKELLQMYIDCSEDYLFRMMELAFAEGFCLGSKLAFESLN